MIGAGSWGTALAMVLADNGHEVRIWGHKPSQIEEINRAHTNQKYLPGISLPESIIGYSSLKEVLKDIEVAILAVPTKAIREVLGKIREVQETPLTIVHVSKGIEPDTLMRISEMIEEEMPDTLLKDVVVLSGPSHAEEVSLRHPTTVTVSSKNMNAAEKFRIYLLINISGYIQILTLSV